MVKENFYRIYIKAFGSDELGKILAKSPESLIGKSIKINLSNLARGKLGEAKGRIKEIKDGKANADPTGIKLYPSYIQRFVRRGATKIDESFIVDAKDQRARVKPVLITRKRIKRSVETALRKELRDFLKKLLAAMTLEDILQSILRGDLQKKLSKRLKKVYPLSFCEIKEVKAVRKK